MKFTKYITLLLLTLTFAIPSHAQTVINSFTHAKKPYLLLIIGPAQSNAGTIDDGTLQETGKNTYATMPSYLQTAPANVDFVRNNANGTLEVVDYTVNTSAGWGWLNQTIYVASTAYTEVIFCKKSLGGTTILPASGGTYPRVSLTQRIPVAITVANSRWGTNNYNIAYAIDIGESNAITSSDADNWDDGIIDFVDNDLRVNYSNAPVIVIKKGRWQVTDFTYIVSNLWAAQDAYIATNPLRNFMVTGYNAGWELLDTPSLDDYSHYNPAGAITMGNFVADKLLSIFSGVKSDRSPPTLVSATVENASPRDVVLTYSESLNPSVVPFWKDWSFNTSRKVTAVAISGSTVTLTASEPFYTGQTIQLTYVKGVYYENTPQDFYGNEVAALTAQAVTNNVSTAVPTYTNVYTSNLSSTVDGWTGTSGGVPARLASWDGQNDVLELGSSDATPVIFRNSTFANTTQQHRVRFEMWVPINIGSAAISNDYNISITTAIGGAFVSNLYPYIRRLPLGGQWVSFEFTAIPSTTGSMRFEAANITSGDKIYIRNITVDRF